MRSTLLCAVVLSAALAQPALAQSSSSSQSGTSAGTSTGQSASSLPQELRTKLQSAGFQDITIVPDSFLVHARDKNNNPVQMVITPTSMMAVTEMSPSGTTGSGSNSNSSSNSSSPSNSTKGSSKQ